MKKTILYTWKDMLRDLLMSPIELLKMKLLDSMFINRDKHIFPPLLSNVKEYQTNNFDWAINAVISNSSESRKVVLYMNTYLSYKVYPTYTAEYIIANNAELLGLDIRYTIDKSKKKYIVKESDSWENANYLITSESCKTK